MTDHIRGGSVTCPPAYTGHATTNSGTLGTPLKQHPAPQTEPLTLCQHSPQLKSGKEMHIFSRIQGLQRPLNGRGYLASACLPALGDPEKGGVM